MLTLSALQIDGLARLTASLDLTHRETCVLRAGEDSRVVVATFTSAAELLGHWSIDAHGNVQGVSSWSSPTAS